MKPAISTTTEIYFTFMLIFFPILLGFIHAYFKGEKKTDWILLYYIFIGVGVQAFLSGIYQILKPYVVVDYVQWPYSPFLLEVGAANISYGILGLASPWLSKGWQRATAIGYSLFLLITGSEHLIDRIINGVNAGNSGGFVYADFGVSIALFVLLAMQYFSSKDSKKTIYSPRMNSEAE